MLNVVVGVDGQLAVDCVGGDLLKGVDCGLHAGDELLIHFREFAEMMPVPADDSSEGVEDRGDGVEAVVAFVDVPYVADGVCGVPGAVDCVDVVDR